MWYGEPHPAVKEEYLHQAKLMNLDSYTSPEASEKLISRLWRRYGTEALALLEDIREDPNQADILIHGTEYTRCEIQQAKHEETPPTGPECDGNHENDTSEGMKRDALFAVEAVVQRSS